MRASRLAVFMVAAVLSIGCGERNGTVDGGAGGGGGVGQATGGGGAASDLRVVTETIASAKVGATYQQPLAATGGVPPYGWHISVKATELAWLSVAGSTGFLSGTPASAAPVGLEVTVAVTDQTAATASRSYSLRVMACQDGETVSCASASGQACLVGTQTCTNGQLPAVCLGAPSADIARCGPLCGACSSTADRCGQGECKCGGAVSCASGEACCGGQCKRLDDVRSCGACGNDCSAHAGVNVTASCALGQCAFACGEATFRHCVGGVTTPPAADESCETDVASDTRNCGDCGHDCTSASDTVAASACVSSQCRLTCKENRLDCDGTPQNGCEQAFDDAHCGACNRPCPTRANAEASHCQADGTCSFQCKSGYADCSGGQENGCETGLWQNSSCGSSCASLVVCGAGQECRAGACFCRLEAAPCPSGTHCGATSGRCECDGTSCGGCCTAAIGGLCVGGWSDAACGRYGGLCAACGSCSGTACDFQRKLCKGTTVDGSCVSGSCVCNPLRVCENNADCGD